MKIRTRSFQICLKYVIFKDGLLSGELAVSKNTFFEYQNKFLLCHVYENIILFCKTFQGHWLFFFHLCSNFAAPINRLLINHITSRKKQFSPLNTKCHTTPSQQINLELPSGLKILSRSLSPNIFALRCPCGRPTRIRYGP